MRDNVKAKGEDGSGLAVVVVLFVVRVRWRHFGDWRRLTGGRVTKIDTAPSTSIILTQFLPKINFTCSGQ